MQNNTILVPNGTSHLNIGDLAITSGLFSLIKKNYSGAEIVFHAQMPETHNPDFADSVKTTIYHWAAFQNTNFFVRSWRMSQFIVAVLMLWLTGRIFAFGVLADLLADYKKASQVIIVGGGFFRTKPGFTQSLNLIMLCMHVVIARLMKKQITVAPMSFGPFAYKWQEWFNAKVLHGLHKVMVREDISYNLLKKYKTPNLVLSADHAFLLENISAKSKEKKQKKIGFTIRSWLDSSSQQHLEQAYIGAISFILNKEKDMYIQPIIQVHAPDYGDDDMEVTERVVSTLKKQENFVNRILEAVVIKDNIHACQMYGGVDILIGMRMHSNIIAATQGTPFIAISYEHKTTGISKMIGMEAYTIDCADITEDWLKEATVEMYSNFEKTTAKLNKNVNILRKKISKDFE